MQHHGAPTRLLDWTYSIYVALFFAVEDLTQGQPAAIWAVDHRYCWNRARQRLPTEVVTLLDADRLRGKLPETFRAILNTKIPMVLPLNPFRLSERVSIQRGIFLAPLDLSLSFMANLRAIDGPNNSLREGLLKLEIATNASWSVVDILRRLHTMNINRRSLFPGLDGSAQSLSGMAGFHPGTYHAQGKKLLE